MTGFTDDVMKRFASDPSLSIEAAVDAELQEVREVLDGLRFMKGGCWCVAAPASTIEPEFKHTNICKRARALSDRLRV